VRFANIFRLALVGALTLGAAPTFADAEPSGRAAKLSAAWGGSLNSDIGEAGALDHPVDFSSFVPRPGRSAEYRRLVALEMQMAAQCNAGVRLATNDRSRAATLPASN
jgi:hypothetical protein